VSEIVATIVQPRCYHPDGPIRSFKTDAIALMEFAEDLIDDANATELPDAPLNPGDHCRFCPAQPKCPAIHALAMQVATKAFSAVQTFDPAKLSQALQMIPQIESWCKAVREHAYQEAMVGRTPVGFKLVDKRATRKWVDAFEPTNKIFYEAKLKSVAVMEKTMGEKDFAKLEGFIMKESSGKSLVPCTDKRAAVHTIEQMFSE
jgi:hypothetical protein